MQTTVQKIADPVVSMAALLASGFEAVSTSHTQRPLATPSILDIKNAGTGRLQLTLQAVPHAPMYEVQSKVDAGGYTSAGCSAIRAR